MVNVCGKPMTKEEFKHWVTLREFDVKRARRLEKEKKKKKK